MKAKAGKGSPSTPGASGTKRGTRSVDRQSQPIHQGLPVVDPDPTARRLLDGLQLLARRFAISERAEMNCCGLSVAQSATLEVLRSEGPKRLSALGCRLGIAPSTLTRNLDRLETAGLVVREMDTEDARAARVRLSSTGRQAAARVRTREEAFANSILKRLPEHRRQAALSGFTDLLVAVREASESCCKGAFDHLMADLPTSGRGVQAKRKGRNGCGCD